MGGLELHLKNLETLNELSFIHKQVDNMNKKTFLKILNKTEKFAKKVVSKKTTKKVKREVVALKTNVDDFKTVAEEFRLKVKREKKTATFLKKHFKK